MCQTSVLVPTRVAALIKIITHNSVAQNDAPMPKKRTMDVYPGRPCNITIANFGRICVKVSKHSKAVKVARRTIEIVYIKDERYLYLSDAHTNKTDSSVSTVHYNRTYDHLEQVEKHKAGKERDEETLKKDFRENELLPAKFDQHPQAFLEMLMEFKSFWNGCIEHINVSKHRINLTNDKVRLVHSARYQAGPVARQFFTEEIN